MNNLYYYHIEGRGKDKGDIKGNFGFFIHILVCSDSSKSAQSLVHEFLDSEDLRISEILDQGEHLDVDIQKLPFTEDLEVLSKKALQNPGTVMFSELDSWQL